MTCAATPNIAGGSVRFLPEAWIGYGADSKTGEFYVKVCFSCPNPQEAVREARPLRTRESLCPSCYNKQLEAKFK